MALHFDGNQFEYAYKPKCFRNWEVPKWYPERPCVNVGSTRIISNDRGHLLPGIPRSSQSPWGNYIGTWHMPKRITRETADKLSAPNQIKIKAWERRCKRQETFKKKHTHEEPAQEKKLPSLVEEEPEEYHRPEICDEKEKTKGQLVPYVPGDLTSPKSRHESYDELSKKRHEEQYVRTSADGFPKNREDFSRCSPPPEEPLEKQVQDFVAQTKEMREHDYGCSKGGVNDDDDEKNPDKCLSPIMDAIYNFKLAKKLHEENLQHDPLPDTITDAVYRRLQMQRHGKDPGLGLEEGQCCTGVAWKGYPGYGATRCTKMKVYRPKTCIHRQKSDEKNERPSSVSSFDLKWRFIRSKKVSPIDLAICWDLIPENPKDEPKPPTHIDGSNGSSAPAVFTLVHTPKDEEKQKEIKCDGIHGCGPVFEHAPGFDPDNLGLPIVNRPKTSNSALIKSDLMKKRAQSAYNCQDKAIQYSEISSKTSTKSSSSKSTAKSHESGNGNSHDLCKKCQKHRLCQTCEARTVPKKLQAPPKSDFKLAFKAGVPQKSKGKRQEYPEHCRLATVYQHSYKPLHLRKRPLLASIFK